MRIMRKSKNILFSFLLFTFLLMLNGCQTGNSKDTKFYVEVTVSDTTTQSVDSLKAIIKNFNTNTEISGLRDRNHANTLVRWLENLDFSKVQTISFNFERIWLLLVLVCAILAFSQFIISFFHKTWKSMLRWLAAFVLLSGYIIYNIGFFTSGTAATFMAYLIRPFLASLGMFIANTSYQEVCEECTSSSLYMLLFGIVHALAILISASFIVSFLWKRVNSYVKRLWWKLTSKDKVINVFFGFNSPSISLARSISSKENKERIVFVDMPTKRDERKELQSLSDLFGLAPYKKEYLDQLKDVHFVLTKADYDISEIEGDSSILNRLGIRFLRKMIRKCSKVRFFFLSEYDKDNISYAKKMEKDSIFDNINMKKTDFYCHASRNNAHLTFEEIRWDEKDKNIAIHIVDSSYLAVQWLKQQPEYLPVNYVEHKAGIVVSDFNALIIGFGETGQEALSFLYEFGAFPDSEYRRSPFHCYIVDRRMVHLKESFYLNHPALVNHDKDVILMDLNDQTSGYSEWLSQIIAKLQYVVVATGSNDENLRIAVDLYELALRKRGNDLQNFTIFVHIPHQIEKCLITKVSNFYSAHNCGIVPFGEVESIFNYDNIITDSTYQKAKEYETLYNIVYSKLPSIAIQNDNKQEESFLGDIYKKRRQESQNISNWLHKETKFRLMDLDGQQIYQLFHNENLDQKQKELKKKLEDICNYSTIHSLCYQKDLNQIDKGSVEALMYNIAVCEHLRWNAAHEMMGYVKGDSKDEVRKQHNCLDDWNSISRIKRFEAPHDMRDLDFIVMETSLKQIKSAKTAND